MMTEDEARKKWCPFARTVGTGSDWARAGADPTVVGASINREPGEYDRDGNETVQLSGRHRCIASACMAWRWHSTHEHVKAGIDVTNGERPRVIGYCGLAGAP